jgi:hypothetical protein
MHSHFPRAVPIQDAYLMSCGKSESNGAPIGASCAEETQALPRVR